MVNKPKVSVICITYNHEDYLSETLDSILNQKTNFDFEVIIHDDASQDNTRKIIEMYTRKNKRIIRPIYQLKNQLSLGVKPSKISVDISHGQYIAYCEGDDYWIDNKKLQKQVDFLEKNKNFSACVTNGYIVNHETGYKRKHFDSHQKIKFSISDLLNGNLFLTCTVMYRKQIFKGLSNVLDKVDASDYATHIVASKFGDIGYLNDLAGVYRLHNKGVWQSKNTISALKFSLRSAIAIRKHILNEISHKWEMNKYIGRLRGKLGSHLFREGQYLKSFFQSIFCFFHPLPSMIYRFKIFKQVIVALIYLPFDIKQNKID